MAQLGSFEPLGCRIEKANGTRNSVLWKFPGQVSSRWLVTECSSRWRQLGQRGARLFGALWGCPPAAMGFEESGGAEAADAGGRQRRSPSASLTALITSSASAQPSPPASQPASLQLNRSNWWRARADDDDDEHDADRSKRCRRCA